MQVENVNDFNMFLNTEVWGIEVLGWNGMLTGTRFPVFCFVRGRILESCGRLVREFQVTSRWVASRFDIGSPDLVQFQQPFDQLGSLFGMIDGFRIFICETDKLKVLFAIDADKFPVTLTNRPL